jgi:hypothetical protein
MNEITEKFKRFLFRWLDTNFDAREFNKDVLKEEHYLVINSNNKEYKIHITLRNERIHISAELFHKMHSFFGVSYGDLSDILREYLSEKLGYDFSMYPTLPN